MLPKEPLIETASYETSLALLLDDFERFLQYVEPADENLATYSHRAYELLLRAATDFESVCKDLLAALDPPVTGTNIRDYVKLEPVLHLEGTEVILFFWRPAPRTEEPFKGWSTASPPLSWYADYNTVKHNREASFSLANLRNVVNAIGALVTLLSLASNSTLSGSQTAFDRRRFFVTYRRFGIASKVPDGG